MAVAPQYKRESIAPGFMTMAARAKVSALEGERDRKARQKLAETQFASDLTRDVFKGVMNVGAVALSKSMEAKSRMELAAAQWEREGPERFKKELQYKHKHNIPIPDPRATVPGPLDMPDDMTGEPMPTERDVYTKAQQAMIEPYYSSGKTKIGLSRLLPKKDAEKIALDSFKLVMDKGGKSYKATIGYILSDAFERDFLEGGAVPEKQMTVKKDKRGNVISRKWEKQWTQPVARAGGTVEGLKAIRAKAMRILLNLKDKGAIDAVQGGSHDLVMDVPVTEFQRAYHDYRSLSKITATAPSIRVSAHAISRGKEKAVAEGAPSALLKIADRKQPGGLYLVTDPNQVQRAAGAPETSVHLSSGWDYLIKQAPDDKKAEYARLKRLAVTTLKHLGTLGHFTTDEMRVMLNPNKGDRWPKSLVEKGIIEKDWRQYGTTVQTAVSTGVSRQMLSGRPGAVMKPDKKPKDGTTPSLDSSFNSILKGFGKEKMSVAKMKKHLTDNAEKFGIGEDRLGNINNENITLPRQLKNNLRGLDAALDFVSQNEAKQSGKQALLAVTNKEDEQVEALVRSLATKAKEKNIGKVEATRQFENWLKLNKLPDYLLNLWKLVTGNEMEGFEDWAASRPDGGRIDPKAMAVARALSAISNMQGASRESRLRRGSHAIGKILGNV